MSIYPRGFLHRMRRIHQAGLYGALSATLCMLCSFLPPAVAHAETVSLTMPNHLMAPAEYRAGEAGKPVVFLLHGFLQTHKFSTIQRLTDELSDNGYAVLAPTLTLNIDDRKTSLTCDAIQSHHFGDHEGEIDTWIHWLLNKGHKDIILLGHSSGSARLLSYLQQQPPSNIRGFIATSFSFPNANVDAESNHAQIARAQAMLQNDEHAIGRFSVAYCKGNYVAPATALISYLSITSDVVIDMIKKTKIPVIVILGGEDKVLPGDWVQRLGETHAEVHVIDGAKHFFNQLHEFDFHDLVLSSLQSIYPGH